MKKTIKLVFGIMLFLPMFVHAFSYTNYNASISNVNNYINQYSDKNKFLVFNTNYDFYDGLVQHNPNFSKGGLLSKQEFDLSKGKTTSYLANGKEYWTITTNGNNQYYVDETIKLKNRDNSSGIRVTEFVKPSVNVNGKGTYANPWTFRDQYNVEFRVSGSAYGSVNKTSVMVDRDTKVEIEIKENTGYMFKNSDCNLTFKGVVNNTTNKYETEPITKDTTCILNFDIRRIKVSYNCNGGTGSTATQTITYGTNYTLSTSGCSKTGYTQTGWKSGTKTWSLGESGTWTYENGTYGITNNAVTLNAVWTPNTYVVNYYQGNGTTTAGVTKIGQKTCSYDSNCVLDSYSSFGKTLPLAAKENSSDCDYRWNFAGWTDSQESLTKKYNDGASFTYNTLGDINLYVLEKRAVYFTSGIAPTTYTNFTQYWNPYKRDTAHVSTINIPAGTNITGWTFNGYKGGSNAADSSVDYAPNLAGTNQNLSPTACRIIRGKYQRTVTLTYNNNGGSGTLANSTTTQYYNSGYVSSGVNTGETISSPSFTLRNNTFTRVGYIFNKWAAGSASGTQYAQNTTYTAFNPGVSANATQNMYATWTKNVVTITIAKSGSAWSNSGVNVVLYSGTTATDYSTTVSSGSTATFQEVPAGTYNIYASKGDNKISTIVDTNIDVVVSGAVAATVNYTPKASGTYTASANCSKSDCNHSGCTVSGQYASASHDCNWETCNKSGCNCNFEYKRVTAYAPNSSACERYCGNLNGSNSSPGWGSGWYDYALDMDSCGCRRCTAGYVYKRIEIVGPSITDCQNLCGNLRTGTYDWYDYALDSESCGCRRCKSTAGPSGTWYDYSNCTKSNANHNGCTCKGTYSETANCTTSTCSKSGCTCYNEL